MRNADQIRSAADELLRGKWEPDAYEIERIAHRLYAIALDVERAESAEDRRRGYREEDL